MVVFLLGQTPFDKSQEHWSDDVKRKEGALVGFWVNYVILTFDLMTLIVDFLRSYFEIAVSQEL